MLLYGKRFNWLYFAQHNPALATAATVLVALSIGYLLYEAIFFVLRRGMPRRDATLFDALRKQCYSPGLLTFFGLGLVLLLPALPLAPEWLAVANRTLAIFQIFCVCWLLIRILAAVRDYSLLRYTAGALHESVRARAAYTQYKIFERILVFIIVVLGLIAALMTFEPVRRLGISLLASAGVVGVIVGFAAQRSLAGVLAGVQIAIAQPIRIDDVVVVEGEWGYVEMITLTFVSIRLWDERRLVVPISYFIEKPFYNWTRTGGDIMGTVFLNLDYGTDLAGLRTEFARLLASSPLWDGRKAIAQVTGVTDRVMELRLLMSAANAEALFDLRCLVREGLLAYLAAHQPEALPRNRVQAL